MPGKITMDPLADPALKTPVMTGLSSLRADASGPSRFGLLVGPVDEYSAIRSVVSTNPPTTMGLSVPVKPLIVPWRRTAEGRFKGS